MGVASFLNELTAWAATRPDIAAIALIGSHARGTVQPRSDVDLVMLCSSVDELLGGDWPTLFGEIESSSIEDYGALKSRRIFYRNGLEVEFGIAERSWAHVPLDSGTKSVLADGARALYDPEQLVEVARRAAVA
jgi:predicted nucleotidyltransferase